MPNPHGLLLGLVHLDFLPHLVEEYLKKINIRWEVACMNLTIKTDWQTQKSLGHQGMDSLRSSLFCFLLAGESKSQGEVTRTHWVREKRGTGGRGWGGKEKPWAEPWHFTKHHLSTNGKDVLADLPAGFGITPIFQLFVCVKEYTSKDLACILVICLLRSLMEEQIAEARSMGLTANSLPEALLGDVGAGKFQLLFSSVFSCAVSVSLEFSVIFLLSKYTDCPKLQILLAQGLQTRSEKFWSRSMEMLVFFKTLANTTPQQSFLLEGLNRFSLDKYPSFWEKLPNFVSNEHWATLGRHTSTFFKPWKITLLTLVLFSWFLFYRKSIWLGLVWQLMPLGNKSN